jgi:predicted AlkP superfamily pyrophosphatase or phosphodiesterase
MENLQSLMTAVKTECIDFAFVYWPDLDGLLHRVGNQSLEVPLKLRGYEQWIERLLDVAREHYEEVRLYVFSDHGMANCDELLDLRARIDALPVQMEKDYAVVYDSTMARFWFFNDGARRQVVEALRQVPQGRILPDKELANLHCLFPDRYFGELIFLVKEGVLIVPSHMGERPIHAMHGYHPSDKHSYAALMTNQAEIPDDIVAIPDIFKLMTRDAELAKAANRSVSGRIESKPAGSRLAVPA